MRRTTFGVLLSWLFCALTSTSVLAATEEFVYVESNNQTAGQNSIFAFRRDGNGTLHTMPGSPFLTGGTGVQDRSFVFGPYDSDNNIVIDAKRRLLFAVNGGSDSIAVMRIAPDGSLTPVPNSPFPSGGTNPVGLALDGDLLFVVNQNGDFTRISSLQPNYRAFRISAGGSLSPVPDGLVEVAFRSSPSQALVVPDDRLIFGADFRGGLLQSLQYDRSGRLRQRPPTALPANPDIPLFLSAELALGEFPLGLAVHPRLPLLYVGFVVTNQLGVYAYDREGDLQFIRKVPNSGLAICWLRANRAGTRLYTSNNGVVGDPVNDKFSTVSVYDLKKPAHPVEIQNLQLAGFGNASQLELSSDERFLYIVAQRAIGVIPEGDGNALHTFRIGSDGTLTELPPVELDVPVGTQPQGVAVLPAR